MTSWSFEPLQLGLTAIVAVAYAARVRALERSGRPVGAWRVWSFAAGIGLVLLLIAVWPANVQMLLDARGSQEPRWWLALLWARLPLQVVLMAWVWHSSRIRRFERRHDGFMKM